MACDETSTDEQHLLHGARTVVPAGSFGNFPGDIVLARGKGGRIVRETAAVDWWRRDNVRAKLRAAVKKILRRHGYPPDLQDEAVRLVIRQAEAMAQEHAAA